VRLQLIQLPQVSSHRAVKVVFYRIISASRQEFGYFRPLIAVFSVSIEQQPLLCSRPISLVNAWVQVIMPPLSALFPRSTLKSPVLDVVTSSQQFRYLCPMLIA
jgi:hypothetical protein